MSKVRSIPPNSYKVIAPFPTTGKMDLRLCIKPEAGTVKYIPQPVFNITKKDGSGNVKNAFLIFLSLASNDTGDEVGYGTDEYGMSIYPARVAKYGVTQNVGFDDTLDEIFIIVFRDNEYDHRYVKYFFDNLDEYYNMAGGPNGDGDFYLAQNIPDPDGNLAKPRTAGLTIIRR